MNTFEIQELKELLDRTIAANSEFFGLLNKLAAIDNGLNSINVLNNEKGINNLIAKYNEGINTVFDLISGSFRPLDFIRKVEEIATFFTEFHDSFDEECQHLESIENSLSQFLKLYEDLFTHRQQETARQIIHFSHTIMNSLSAFRDLLNFLANSLTYEVFDSGDHMERFNLNLFAELELKEFANRLSILDSMYSEACFLLNVDASSSPIQVAKIESGSLLADLMGNKEVIGVMVVFVTAVTRFIYRNYTFEGKIKSLPKRFKDLDKALELTSKLESKGINTEAIKENIEKSAIKLSGNTLKLIKGASVVRVNKEDVDIKDELKDRFIEDSNKKLIENADPSKE